MKLKRSNFLISISIIYALLFLFFWWFSNFRSENIFEYMWYGVFSAVLSLPWTFLIPFDFLAPDEFSLPFYTFSFVPGLLNFCILFFGIPFVRKWLNNPKGKV